MKKPSISNALVGLCLFLLAACQPPLPKLETKPELGLQTWTFRKLTLVEAIAKASQLGIHTIEAYPGQKLGGGIEGNLTPDLESKKLAALKKILAENKVSISGFGVIMQATEEEWKQLFAFAKSLGIHWISSEPPADMLPAIARMAKESGVRVAIHNHPLPSRYYDPVALLKTIEPYGPEIGLCADTGHWARSGLNPLEKLRLAPDRHQTRRMAQWVDFCPRPGNPGGDRRAESERGQPAFLDHRQTHPRWLLKPCGQSPQRPSAKRSHRFAGFLRPHRVPQPLDPRTLSFSNLSYKKHQHCPTPSWGQSHIFTFFASRRLPGAGGLNLLFLSLPRL